ncbi:MAG: ABC transporter substrate-binding protein [Acidimicrobiales bacterium]
MLAGALALGLLAAGCGRGDDGTASDPGTTPSSSAALAPAAAPGFDPAAGTIKVGSLTALSGPLTSLADPLNAGTRAFFQAVNAAGGVGGRYRVELVEEDTRFDNPTTVQKYQKIKDQVTMFGQILGTGPISAVLPQIKADNIMALPASLDERWIAEPNLLPYGAPYQVQFLNGANYYANELQGRQNKICSLAIEGPYGDAGLRGVEAAAAAESLALATVARFRSGETDFTAQVTQLKDSGCQAVFLTALPANTGVVLGTALKLGFRPQWLAQSPAWEPAMVDFPELAPVLDNEFLLLSEAAQWGDDSVPGMARLLADAARFAPDQKPDLYFIAGYVQGWAVERLLAKAVELGDLSRAGMFDAQRRLGTVSFGGLYGDYTYGPPEQRNPSRTTTVYAVDRTVAGSLRALKKNVSSPAAASFKF